MDTHQIERLRSPLVRVGFGLSAIGALCVGLWPTAEVVLDPEKCFAFAAALLAWLFVEIYPEVSSASPRPDDLSRSITPHDTDLAAELIGIANGNFVRFLEEHEFGSTWRKTSADPAYDLEDFLNDTNSVFEDKILNSNLMNVKMANDVFIDKISHYGGPVSGLEFFDMIPRAEKASGNLSQRTKLRISETNEAASELANALAALFSVIRKNGISLVRKSLAEVSP